MLTSELKILGGAHFRRRSLLLKILLILKGRLESAWQSGPKIKTGFMPVH
jgi:hypothetical protein